MYNFSDFYGLIIVLLSVAIIFLVYKRIRERKDEDFEDRDY